MMVFPVDENEYPFLFDAIFVTLLPDNVNVELSDISNHTLKSVSSTGNKFHLSNNSYVAEYFDNSLIVHGFHRF